MYLNRLCWKHISNSILSNRGAIPTKAAVAAMRRPFLFLSVLSAVDTGVERVKRAVSGLSVVGLPPAACDANTEGNFAVWAVLRGAYSISVDGLTLRALAIAAIISILAAGGCLPSIR